MSERRSFSPWISRQHPRRVLVIRFHALGDVAIVLPSAVHCAWRWPESAIDMLTMPPADTLAEAVPIFHSVMTIPRGRGPLERILTAVVTGFSLRRRKYDVVVDLQRNYVSRLIRMISGAPSWSEFDRYSPLPASVRVLSTVAAAGMESPAHEIPVPLSGTVSESALRLLGNEGWDGSTRLVVFNPAGLWESRNWPISSYVELYRLWSARESVRVLVLGTESIRARGERIARDSGMGVINLAGKTTAGEALALLRHAAIIITEDSGLMHMAWAAGVPIVALFGSTRSDWSAPKGDRSVCLDSADLECGCCMQPVCRFGDVHCLTRRSPRDVLEAALGLLGRLHQESQPART